MLTSYNQAPYQIDPNDRPFIAFRRVLNKGISKRTERLDKEGKIKRAAHPGEFEEIWVKALISHRAPYDVYTWATPDWALRQMQLGRVPVDYGNLDKLPANYPREWLERIRACISVIQGAADANKQLDALKVSQEKSNEATIVSGQEGLTRSKRERVQEAPRTAGQTADTARV